MMGRIFGVWARHGASLLQAIQLIINCGIICLSNGGSLSQMSQGPSEGAAKICYTVAILVFALFGMILGQIRTLKGFGLVANFSFWINILIMILTMGFVANSPPNYASANLSYGYITDGPVQVSAVVTAPLFTQVNGVFNMVFAYGGEWPFF